MPETMQGRGAALISTERGWGGGEEQARLLSLGLLRRGARCVVFARRASPVATRMAAAGIEVLEYTGRGRSPAALWRIRRQLVRFRPDVLHYNDSHALSGPGLAALGLPIPARVASRRTIFPLRSTRHYRLLADRVACVSEAVARVCAAGGLPGSMLRVVRDGADPARAASGDGPRGRRSLGLAADRPVLLCVAKLTECKGLRYLLDALPEILRRRADAIALVAGDGELRAALEEQARGLGIAEHVRFLGFRDDVADLIRAADLFVLPSHTEALCSTLIDVMLAGRAIVTTTAGGIPELVGPRAGGDEPVAWLAPPRDAAALAQAIVAALDSPEARSRFEHLARRRALAEFTAEKMIEATLGVYKEMLPGGRAAGR